MRCELDAGFKPGRQFGRGMSGGQVRDERRQSHDASRGGEGGGSLGENHVGKKRGRDSNDFNNSHRRVFASDQFGRDRMTKQRDARRKVDNSYLARYTLKNVLCSEIFLLLNCNLYQS